MKKYTQAPLPFQGQKRRFLKPFKTALESFPADAVYVDLFGGSGLLSHTVKQMLCWLIFVKFAPKNHVRKELVMVCKMKL